MINEAIDPSIFKQALNNVITHHEILRVKFERDKHVWKQIVVHPNKIKAPVDVYNLSHLVEDEQLDFIQENVLGLLAELDLAMGL